MLSIAINYPNEYNLLLKFLYNSTIYVPHIKFEPALKRSISFMHADGLIDINTYKDSLNRKWKDISFRTYG